MLSRFSHVRLCDPIDGSPPGSSVNSKEIKPSNSKGNQPWIGSSDAEAEAPVHWPPDGKSQLIGKDPDAGKDGKQKKKGVAEDDMVGWHHWLNGREFEQTPGKWSYDKACLCICSVSQFFVAWEKPEPGRWRRTITCRWGVTISAGEPTGLRLCVGYFPTQDSFHLCSFPWAETPSHRRKIDTFFLGLCDVPPGNSGLSERWLGEGFDLFASLCLCFPRSCWPWGVEKPLSFRVGLRSLLDLVSFISC